MKPLVLYHDDTDGFAAAWCAFRRFGTEAEYRPVNYGDDPPADDLHGRDVYILDFSYLPEFIEKMAEEANKIVLIDHHKSALERFAEAWGDARSHSVLIEGFHAWHWDRAIVFVDLGRSGSQLTWDWFGAGGAPVPPTLAGPYPPYPWFIDYVADRDLWAWKLPQSREVNAYIQSLPHGWCVWDEMLAAEQETGQLTPAEVAATLGRAILNMQAREIERAVRRARRALAFSMPKGTPPPYPMVVNATENVSEVLEVLAKEPPHWAIGWYQSAEGRYLYSLRASPEGPDVSTIARAFGGGGHARSSGFESANLLF